MTIPQRRASICWTNYPRHTVEVADNAISETLDDNSDNAPTGRSFRALYLLPDFGVGGGQTILLRTVVAQMAAGRGEYVVCGLRGGPLLEQFRDAGVHCLVLDLEGPTSHLGALRDLRAVLRKERVEVICSFNTPLDRTYAQLAGALCKVPVVIWFMSVAIPLLRFPPARGRELAFLKRLVLLPINAVTARRAAARMSLSGSVAATFARHLRLPANSFALVPPGLPAAFYEPPAGAKEIADLRSSLCGGNGGPVLLNIGMLIDLKGQQHLIPMMQYVTQDLPEAHLVLVGDGPNRQSLIDTVSSLGLQVQVHVLGHRHDVPALLAASDVLLSASASEGFGMTVLEAMAAGKPVVAAYTPAFEEFAEEGTTALFVERPDAELLAAAVVDLCRDPDRVAAFGAAGSRAAEAFRVESTAEKVDAIFARVASAHRN